MLQDQPKSDGGHIGVYRVSCLTRVTDLMCSGCKLREGRTESTNILLCCWLFLLVHRLRAAAHWVDPLCSNTLTVPFKNSGTGG